MLKTFINYTRRLDEMQEFFKKIFPLSSRLQLTNGHQSQLSELATLILYFI